MAKTRDWEETREQRFYRKNLTVERAFHGVWRCPMAGFRTWTSQKHSKFYQCRFGP